MIRKTLLVSAAAMFLVAATASAQATMTPSFNAPRRAFSQSEFGAVVSFPDGGGTAYEGDYRIASHSVDIGLRGGVMDYNGAASSQLLAGVEARANMIRHDRTFPLDGALIVGGGGRFESGQSRIDVPLGLSLGRRVPLQGSSVSLEPYVQPTAFLRAGNNMSTNVIYTLGLGTDLNMGGAFNARLGVGLGDVEGVSLGAVWTH
jgi:hypothetical protein